MEVPIAFARRDRAPRVLGGIPVGSGALARKLGIHISAFIKRESDTLGEGVYRQPITMVAHHGHRGKVAMRLHCPGPNVMRRVLVAPRAMKYDLHALFAFQTAYSCKTFLILVEAPRGRSGTEAMNSSNSRLCASMAS